MLSSMTASSAFSFSGFSLVLQPVSSVTAGTFAGILVLFAVASEELCSFNFFFSAISFLMASFLNQIRTKHVEMIRILSIVFNDYNIDKQIKQK